MRRVVVGAAVIFYRSRSWRRKGASSIGLQNISGNSSYYRSTIPLRARVLRLSGHRESVERIAAYAGRSATSASTMGGAWPGRLG